jgi:DNA polymerase III subunit gamma/tau
MGDVLALKYRPTTFEEIIGQDVIIKQLQSALENGTLGHTLLLCGTLILRSGSEGTISF